MKSCFSLPRVLLNMRPLGAFLGAVVAALAMAGSLQAAPAVVEVQDAEIALVRGLLELHESDIDLAKAKVAIDRLIDPTIDGAATLAKLDAMAQGLRAMLPAGASKRLMLDALRYHVYTASPWNGHRPFQYDLDDPFGANVRSKLLSTYLETRKGNCVSMPLLFIVLGQKLGIDMTASTAPNHVFVKYRDDEGKLYNLETTSGAGFTRDVWMREQYPMTDEALASGIYMRPLTKKETVGVMVHTLLESYRERGLHEQRIRMSDLLLQHNPRDVVAILNMHGSYLWLRNLTVNQHALGMPAHVYKAVSRANDILGVLYQRAFALGWRPPSEEAEEKYRQTIIRAKQTQQP